jgi:hypothetical protein
VRVDGKRPPRHRIAHAIDANGLALDRKRAALDENTRSVAQNSVGIGRNTPGVDEIDIAQLGNRLRTTGNRLQSCWDHPLKTRKANQLQSLAHGRTH